MARTPVKRRQSRKLSVGAAASQRRGEVRRIEDRLDNRAAEAALREPGANIPLGRLKAELGLK